MHTSNISPLQSMRWYYSVSAKIARIVPGHTLSLILLTLASQLSLLAASFLPLKAIILIGSPSIPEYFPEAWKILGRENLFIGLSVAAITSYFFYLLAEKSIRNLTEAGSGILLANSNKMTLFEGQDNIASRAYLRFTRSLASVVFVTVTFFLLGALYSALMLAICAFWLGLAALFFLMRTTSKLQQEKLLKFINETPNAVASIGFLAAFGFMIYDFLDGSPPEVFTALIGVLLSRQIMHRVAILAHDTNSLIAQHLQLSALFFHAHKVLPHQGSGDASFWSLFEKERQPDWLDTLIYEITGKHFVNFEASWHQTGVHDIAALEVSAQCIPSGNIELFLVKIFNLKRSILAINEATLLAEAIPCNLPTLPFLGAGSISEFHCHLFQWGHFRKFEPLEFKEPTYAILQRMMLTSPPRSLVKLFSRSHPLIWDRLSASKLSHFTLAVSTTKHENHLDAFLASREHILAILRSLPLQVTNVEIGNDHLLADFEGKKFVSHWGAWSLETVGAGWPTSKKELQRLERVFDELQRSRPAMTDVSVHALKLSALMFTFDKLLTKQHFISANLLLPEIMGAYAQHAESRTPETSR